MSIWFDGPVAAAVGTADTKQCILLVCLLQADDEASIQYEAQFTEEPLATGLASMDLVALKVLKESQDGILFGQIYPIMSVPAVYLIRNGLLADFMPAQIESAQMLERIQKATQGHFAIPPPPGTVLPTAGATGSADNSASNSTPQSPAPLTEQPATPLLIPSTSEAAESSTISSSSSVVSESPSGSEASVASKQESVKEKLKKLQEERRIQREKEEREAAKKRELDRRANSKALQEAQSELKDKEAKKLKDKIEREKREEAEYRKKLKQQLEEDKLRRKAERERERERLEAAKRAEAATASRPGSAPSSPAVGGGGEVLIPSEVRKQNSGLWNARNDASSSLACESTRLNVRLFDGSSIRNVFQSTDTLSAVRLWIDQNRGDDETPYNIVQVIPPRTFTDEEKTLRDLDLCPSATLVLKPIARSAHAYGGSDGGAVSSLMGLGWSALNLAGKAASAAYNTVSYYNPLRGPDASQSTSSSFDALGSSSSSSATARAKKNDDDDRDKRRTTTYNGNSTSLE